MSERHATIAEARSVRGAVRFGCCHMAAARAPLRVMLCPSYCADLFGSSRLPVNRESNRRYHRKLKKITESARRNQRFEHQSLDTVAVAEFAARGGDVPSAGAIFNGRAVPNSDV